MMAKPKILILDEPCAGLDPAAREHFLGFIQRLGYRSPTPSMVLVTHHVEEIMPAFSHLMVMKSGAIIGMGEISTTMKRELLSEAFNAPCKVKRANGRFSLDIRVRGSEKIV
jgi:iron complex transport system ATP-binding protein